MVEILEHGTYVKKYVHTCENCGCKYTFTKPDYDAGLEYYIGRTYYATGKVNDAGKECRIVFCPECKEAGKNYLTLDEEYVEPAAAKKTNKKAEEA